MKKKEEKILQNIREAILVVCSIECQKCLKSEKDYNTDEYCFSERLFSKGWTFKRDKILCNECS